MSGEFAGGLVINSEFASFAREKIKWRIRQQNSLPQGSRRVGHEITGWLRHRLRKATFPERFPLL